MGTTAPDRGAEEVLQSLFDQAVNAPPSERGQFGLEQRRRCEKALGITPAEEDTVMSPAYASYMNRIALIAYPLEAGHTKWSTRAATESGCGSWLTRQFSAWSIRTSSVDNPSPSLPAIEDTAAAAGNPAAAAAARGPHLRALSAPIQSTFFFLKSYDEN